MCVCQCVSACVCFCVGMCVGLQPAVLFRGADEGPGIISAGEEEGLGSATDRVYGEQ